MNNAMPHIPPLTLKEPEREFIAFCQCGCGALVFVAADFGNKDAQLDKEIAALVRDGHEVKRVARGEAKQLLAERAFGCTQISAQPPSDQQLSLYTESNDG